jgi:hypothetical protein
MIKNFTPQQYKGLNPLPVYVANARCYTLVATVSGDYTITLAKLTVGDSISAGKPLYHVLFESFNDHGERMATARTRVNGYDRSFIAVKDAMIETGIEFHPVLSSPCETILRSLGEWFMAQNPEITAFYLVSQTCH